MGGQMIHSTVIEARGLTQAEKDTIKGGGTPAEWTLARRAQTDPDGRWVPGLDVNRHGIRTPF
jgi:transposase, IS5 family